KVFSFWEFNVRKALVVRLSTSLLAVGAMDLQSLYDQALVSTESIQIQKQEIYQRREDLRQARGALLPSLDYNYRWLSQEIPSSSNGANSSFRQNEQTTSWVHLSHPLF